MERARLCLRKKEEATNTLLDNDRHKRFQFEFICKLIQAETKQTNKTRSKCRNVSPFY